MGAKGGSALAAVLKETQITDLRCAAPQSVFTLVLSANLHYTRHHSNSAARSLRNSRLGPHGAFAFAQGLKGNSTLQSLE